MVVVSISQQRNPETNMKERERDRPYLFQRQTTIKTNFVF